MTINKFGNYLFTKTQQHRLKEEPLVKTTKEIQLKTICILTLRGSFVTGSEAYYMFENNKQSYQFKKMVKYRI